jgi:Tol biopolymer transport system component
MNADGSDLTQINAGLRPPNSHNPAWSIDGQKIAFSNGDYLGFWTVVYTINADGTQRRQLSPNNLPGYGGNLAWAPIGKLLAFAVMNYAGITNESTIYIIDTEDGLTRKLVSKPDNDIDALLWSSDSTQYYSST